MATTNFPITQKVGSDSTVYYTATRLKPDSFYSLIVRANGADLTNITYQAGIRNYGDPVTKKLKSNSSGNITFRISLATGLFGSAYFNFATIYDLRGPDNVVTPVPPAPSPSVPQGAPENWTGWNKVRPSVPENSVNVPTYGQTTSTPRVFNQGTTVTMDYGGKRPLSEVTLYFDYIQTFTIDPAAVQNSSTIDLTEIELFFDQKPQSSSAINLSGIDNPGVMIYLCEMKTVDNNLQPDLTKVYRESIIRKGYDQVHASLDASVGTTFAFNNPFTVDTGKTYGIVINFEDPQYSLWEAKKGVNLLNTTTVYTGGYEGGQLFRASNYDELSTSSQNPPLLRAVADTDLKFNVSVFVPDEVIPPPGPIPEPTPPPIPQPEPRVAAIQLVNDDYEFLTIGDVSEGITGSGFIFGEDLFQWFGNTSANVTFYKEGTLDIVQNSKDITGTDTQFTNNLEIGDVVIITDGTTNNTDVRSVARVSSATSITLDLPVNFTNSTARYSITPIGRLENSIPATNTIILNHSTAKEGSRFVSDGINYITWTSGSGYSNSDYIVFSGGTEDGKAVITTNTTGHIAQLNITQPGYGFTTTPTATVYKPDGTLRTPSPSTITATPGSQLRGEHSRASAPISNVNIYSVDHAISKLMFSSSSGEVSNITLNFAYEAEGNYAIDRDTELPVVGTDSIDITGYNAVIVSKSLELLNKSTLDYTGGKSATISFDLTSTSNFESPQLHAELASMDLFTNQINNDSTNEHKNSGSAFSRHITTKVKFDKDRFAEDIRVIASMYRPLGTNVKIYAKIHNSKDEDAFDDKDWTELEEKEATFGDRFYSSSSNPDDLVEVTYGFKQYPTIIKTLNGLARVYSASDNTTVTGVNTTFNSDIANGDVIVLYESTTFANAVYAVAVVANTPTATGFEISKPLANVSLAAATLRVGVTSNSTIDFSHSAFNNIQNENVVRYYSTSVTPFDTYDTFALKVVLLSDTTYVVPRVETLSAIGTSA